MLRSSTATIRRSGPRAVRAAGFVDGRGGRAISRASSASVASGRRRRSPATRRAAPRPPRRAGATRVGAGTRRRRPAVARPRPHGLPAVSCYNAAIVLPRRAPMLTRLAAIVLALPSPAVRPPSPRSASTRRPTCRASPTRSTASSRTCVRDDAKFKRVRRAAAPRHRVGARAVRHRRQGDRARSSSATLVQLDWLEGRYDDALARLARMQALEDKPADKLLSGHAAARDGRRAAQDRQRDVATRIARGSRRA